MAVQTLKSVFYHIPKTGGIATKQAMHRSGLYYNRSKNDKNSHPFALRREHSTYSNTLDVDNLFSFCFVRHPVTWYCSFWAYRVKSNKLSLKFPLDRVWDDNFNKFVNNVIDEYGNFITQLYQYYVGENCDKVNFIGKQESMLTDLVIALTLAGEQFDKYKVLGTRRFNVASASRKFRKLTVMDEFTTERVLITEKWIMDKFYA
jgi:hypothetical protein